MSKKPKNKGLIVLTPTYIAEQFLNLQKKRNVRIIDFLVEDTDSNEKFLVSEAQLYMDEGQTDG